MTPQESSAIEYPCSCGSESTRSAHSVTAGQVFSKYYCDSCWATRGQDRPHKKSWSCVNPCGDGCDGNHTPEEASE